MSYEGKRRAAYHDLTHSPVGLWQFDGNLLDSSGNGFHLSVETGTERYSVMPGGLKCAYFDGSSNFYHNVANTALLISGSLTIASIVTMPDHVSDRTVVTYSGVGDSNSTTNYQYMLGSLVSGTGFRSLWEQGTGVNVEYATTSVPGTGYPIHLGMTRDASDGNKVRFYVNGKQMGDTSGSLTGPTGGTASILRVAANETGQRWLGHIASLKITASCLSDAQILSEYNRTIGTFLGRRS